MKIKMKTKRSQSKEKLDKLSGGKKNIFFFIAKNSHGLVNGIRFTDEKKNRHDDDMEFDQVVLECVDTWRRSIVIRKDSTRQEWRYHEGVDVCSLNIFIKSKIWHITSSISDHLLKKKSLTLSLVMTKILRYLISRCHSFPQKYQNEKFRIDIKELNVQLKIESFIKRARVKSFSSASRWIQYFQEHTHVYIHMCFWKNYEHFEKLILHNDFLWNRDFNFDVHFIN